MGIQRLELEYIQAASNVISARKLRYATDEDYRTNAKNISRNAYRRKTGMETDSCLYSLEFLDKISKEFTVQRVGYPNKARSIQGFNMPMTADALQQLYQTVWRWIQNSIIPAPIYLRVGHSGKRPYYIYHTEEVRILIEEIGNHSQEMAYLRKDHLEVRGRIEQRILKLRHTLKI